MNNYEITPVGDRNYISKSNGYEQLKLTSEQKMHISALANQIPIMIAVDGMTDTALYRLEFPEGVYGSLMELKRGGKTTTIVGADGKIAGTASIQEVNTATMATALQAFTVMSVLSNQYFLAEINSKLNKIGKSLDQILEFLYGDKKAELLSEISFTKYAYQNYSSIVSNNDQRIATIGSIQQAKKVAIKDIEFYLHNLESLITGKGGSKLAGVMEESFRIKDCLELSIQLYVMSTILEMYYAQNFDESYILNVENETSVYITKCDKQILGAFAVLKDNVQNYRSAPLEKFDKNGWLNQIERIVEPLGRGEESEMKRSIHSALYSFNRRADFCIDRNGEAYIKAV